jgi:hypothetical protein
VKIIERPKISGEEWLLIICDRCEQKFLVAPNEFNANGSIKCEFCPNIERKENIDSVTENTHEAWSPESEGTKEEQK